MRIENSKSCKQAAEYIAGIPQKNLETPECLVISIKCPEAILEKMCKIFQK